MPRKKKTILIDDVIFSKSKQDYMIDKRILLEKYLMKLIDFVNSNDVIVPDISLKYRGFEINLTFKKLEEGKPED